MTLPRRGLTVLEASAGTGKTHRATSIALEAVAAGVPTRQLLLVTFTRSATSELRDKVWHRLVAAESALAHLGEGRSPHLDDPVLAALAAEPAAAAVHHHRIAQALASFDAATIATIHGFCEQVLARVGFAGDVERDVDFVEDLRPLIEEVVDDLLVQKLDRDTDVVFDRAEARTIAERVLNNPGAAIVPDRPRTERAAMYTGFARVVRQRLEERKRARRLIGYDDLLARLAETLAGASGHLVRRWLRSTFEIVVVDEFQDTDVVQWEILRRAFVEPGEADPARIVVVGDPKQAIYGFRGADVHAYLDARRDAHVEHLDENWRSDAGLLRAVDALFGDAELGHPEIVFRSSHAAAHLRQPRLVDGLKCEPLRIRVLTRSQDGAVMTDRSGDLRQRWAVSHVARDLAADVVHRLEGTRGRVAALVQRGTDGAEHGRRTVRPGDIAVLVRSNRDAETVRSALADVGVPAVVNGTTNVFATDAARHWRTLLEALEQPASTTRVHTAAVGPLVGWTPEQLAGDAETDRDELLARIQRWRRTLLDHGIAALDEQVAAETGYRARLLAGVGGERVVTDLGHVVELLHAHERSHDGGPANLVTWLGHQVAGADDDADDQHRHRRLETDDDAVQVWTIHRSKGLEFPIVYVPYPWKPPARPRHGFPAVFHDETGRRCIDVAIDDHDHAEAERAHRREEDGEELRLAYVAFTRARSQVVTWWAPTHGAADSPLGRLLFPETSRTHGRWGTDTPGDDQVALVLEQRRRLAPDDVRIEESHRDDDARWSPARPEGRLVGPAVFDRSLDRTWRRTSYSALTAAAYAASHRGAAAEEEDDAPIAAGREHDDPMAAPEHDDRGLEDERLGDGDTSVPPGVADAELERALRATDLPLADVGAGARFGTMVHEVLESVDFESRDLAAAVDLALEAAQRVHGHPAGNPFDDPFDDPFDRTRLRDGLVSAIETPLGPLVGDRRLRDLARGDRLDELHFEFPLAGGDAPVGHVTMEAIADLVDAHLPADDPLAGYGRDLTRPELAARVRGYLSGAIDVVARVDGRFVVVDHKSNRLGQPDEDLSAWHYRPGALAAAMRRAHYPLQALIYQVAVHRYLRWRLPDYDPERHLGGVLYLFLRGMTGPDVPRVDGAPCGVFAWRPPSRLVGALSDLLATGVPGARP